MPWAGPRTPNSTRFRPVPQPASSRLGRAGANRELVDPVTVFQPFVQYSRDRQPGVPLWNPHIQAGRPLLADEQSAVFSPFSLPSYVLPFWWSLSLVGVLKLVVAALGT